MNTKRSRVVVEKTCEGSSILKLSWSEVKKNTRAVDRSRVVVEKNHQGSTILNLSWSGVEKTREGSNDPC